MNGRRERIGKNILLLGNGDILSLSVIRAMAEEVSGQIHEYAVNPVSVEMSKYSHHLESYESDEREFRQLTPAQLIDQYKHDQNMLLLPVTELAILWASEYQNQLKSHFIVPPLPEPETMYLVMEKWKLQNWLKSQGFDFPVSMVWQEGDRKFEEYLASTEYPKILKSMLEIPVKQIEYVESRSHLMQIREHIKNNPEDNIIQEIITGIDYDCSILADQGRVLAYTIQKPLTTRKLRYAASIKLFNDSDFFKIVKKMVQELNWSGVAHLDFRYNEALHKYYLIDFNPRYWGTLLGSVCAGVNIPYLQIKSALGYKIKPPTIHPTYFMMNREALQQIYKRLFNRKERMKEFRLRNSELSFTLEDPLPELHRRYWRKTG